MSEHHGHSGTDASPRPRIRARMIARSPSEVHRASTPLELFFDLVFVVAIAQAASGLHHSVSEAHALEGIVGYFMVFFAIWWAWMNFTWFASAYDCDDVAYRLVVFVQITGALVMAAGVKGFFDTHNADIATILGYVVMRIALVVQWLRAAASDPKRRATARRYASSIALLQVLWVGSVFVPSMWPATFLVLVILELLVPVWSEHNEPTTWHPQHIAERYGLLTLIVLGESVLSATTAIQSALSAGGKLAALAPTIVGGLLIAYSMWWQYFDRPVHDLLTSFRKAIIWGYGHYFIFASAAAVGAGLGVSVDQATHHAKIDVVGAGFAVAIPVAVYVMLLWWLHHRPEYEQTRALGPIAAILILLTPFSGQAALFTGIIMAGMMAMKLTLRARQLVPSV